MQLITMAHPGEAQGVIESFSLQKRGEDVWVGGQFVLLITGEGPFEAATRVALELSRHPIDRILNIGIAGTISEEVSIGDTVEVRSVYLVHDLKPAYRTFQLAATGVDCLTSFERILDPEKAQVLRGVGTIVDRELWGVAMAAKTAGIPLSAWKLISDDAGSLKACELVKEFAHELSTKIAQKLAQSFPNTAQAPLLPAGFHVTFSMRHRFETLLNKLALKEQHSLDEVLTSLPLKDLLEKELAPKERAKKLLDILEHRIDPVRKVVSATTDQLQREFAREGLKLSLDPTFEDPKATISFEAHNDEILKEKIAALSRVSLLPLEKLMKGDFHVE